MIYNGKCVDQPKFNIVTKYQFLGEFLSFQGDETCGPRKLKSSLIVEFICYSHFFIWIGFFISNPIWMGSWNPLVQSVRIWRVKSKNWNMNLNVGKSCKFYIANICFFSFRFLNIFGPRMLGLQAANVLLDLGRKFYAFLSKRHSTYKFGLWDVRRLTYLAYKNKRKIPPKNGKTNLTLLYIHEIQLPLLRLSIYDSRTRTCFVCSLMSALDQASRQMFHHGPISNHGLDEIEGHTQLVQQFFGVHQLAQLQLSGNFIYRFIIIGWRWWWGDRFFVGTQKKSPMSASQICLEGGREEECWE